MNDFYKGLILSVLRKALTGVSAVLVTNGWLTDGQVTELTLGIAGLIVSLLLSFWDQYGKQLTTLSALQLPKGATLQEAKALAKTDSAPPVATPNNVAPPPASSGDLIKATGHGLMIALALSGAMTMAACAAKSDPNISPERKVALYGTQVATHLDSVQTAATELHTKQVITEPQFRKVLETLKKANTAGEQLGAALRAYDAATSVADRNAIVTQVDAALVTLNTLLPNLIPEVTNEAGRGKILQIITDVQKIILTIARFTQPPASAILRHDFAIAA